jgi:Pyruvate/2-oxoacid:ferredoxin oxidoreductase delta subunit
MFGSKRLKALSFLGFHFNSHLLKKLIPFKRRGLQHFKNDYRNDKIYSIAQEDRDKMPSFSRCYTCKICDTYCPQGNPSYLVQTFSRSLTDFDLLIPLASCGGCDLCEKHCPQHVPIKQIVQFMTKYKSEIE